MNNHKQLQYAIIQSTNPAPDDYHTWMRTIKDILTFEEAWEVERPRLYQRRCREGDEDGTGDRL